jgi:predicted ester cyclase
MAKGWMHSEIRGHSGVREAIERVQTAFSEWAETVEDIIADGDKVVARYVSTGLHVGPFIDLAATGKRICEDDISIFRLPGDFVAEKWSLVDDVSLARQFGRFWDRRTSDIRPLRNLRITQIFPVRFC